MDELERLLHRYRPVGPSAALRRRILTDRRASRRPSRGGWLTWLLPAFPIGMAMLLYALGAATRNAIPLVPADDPASRAWTAELDRAFDGNRIARDAAARAIELDVRVSMP